MTVQAHNALITHPNLIVIDPVGIPAALYEIDMKHVRGFLEKCSEATLAVYLPGTENRYRVRVRRYADEPEYMLFGTSNPETMFDYLKANTSHLMGQPTKKTYTWWLSYISGATGREQSSDGGGYGLRKNAEAMLASAIKTVEARKGTVTSQEIREHDAPIDKMTIEDILPLQYPDYAAELEAVKREA